MKPYLDNPNATYDIKEALRRQKSIDEEHDQIDRQRKLNEEQAQLMRKQALDSKRQSKWMIATFIVATLSLLVTIFALFK